MWTEWKKSLPDLSLTGSDTHVWRIRLEPGTAQLSALWHLLSEDERERAGRFYFQKDRDHYIIARGALRTILGSYSGAHPASLRFHYSAYGKPSLAGESSLRFNLTHSQGLALAALTAGREVGVDIEHLGRDLGGEEIARRFFSSAEVSSLTALPAAQQTEAFFTCWTRKEAYIKARGEGLSLPLDQFDVTLAPGQPAALLATRPDPAEAARWTLQALDPGPGYVAALAVEGELKKLMYWDWESLQSY